MMLDAARRRVRDARRARRPARLGAQAEDCARAGAVSPVEDIVHRTRARAAGARRTRLSGASTRWRRCGAASSRWRTEVLEQLGCVGADAGDQVRPAAPQERQPEQVETGEAGDAAVVDDPVAVVERAPDRATGTTAGSRSPRSPSRTASSSSSVGTAPELGRARPDRGPDLAVEPVLVATNSSMRSSRRACLGRRWPRGWPATPRTARRHRRSAMSRPTSRTPRVAQRVADRGRAVDGADELHRARVAALVRCRRPRRSARRAGRSRPSTSRCRGPGTSAEGARARRPRSSPRRPLRCSSSAIWTPEADAPTTSTSPSASSCAGAAVVQRGELVDSARERRPRATGREARSSAPVAATTASHCQRPWSVTTSKPASVARPPAHGDAGQHRRGRGAAGSRRGTTTTSAAVMNPSGSSP